MKKQFVIIPIALISAVEFAAAHCPLCVVGAAAAAAGASYIGINIAAIGVFIGAFAVAMGWWIAKIITKKFPNFKLNNALLPILIVFSFVTTVIPLMPLFKGISPIYIEWFGSYGSVFNRTYVLNLFLTGSTIGGLIIVITPWLSGFITKLRNGKLIPYQGIGLTFALLLVAGIILQLVF